MEVRIQRYQGNEIEQEVSAVTQSDIFQARIEERRQKRKGCLEKNDTAEQSNNENENVGDVKNKDDGHETVKKKKKKKSQPVVEEMDISNIPNDVTDTNEISTLESTSQRKKKKLRHKNINSHQMANVDAQNEICKENVEKNSEHNVAGDNCNSKVGDTESIGNVKCNEENLNLGSEEKQPENENNEKLNEELIPSAECFPILGKHNKVKKTIVKRTLPRWLNEPIYMSADIYSCKCHINSVDFLSETMINNLTSNGIEHLFPVQSSVIQKIMSQNIRIINKFPPNDICVQAPTGSGKTLAYVLPIIDVLRKYVVRQLYCLVVVPSKDLALQVKKVFDTYVAGTNLKVGLASGLKTFPKEQEKLVARGDGRFCCNVDIVVCTPGRLVDHLKQTDGFTLRNLRFLVVDEADRLLGQDYSGWLAEVKTSVHSPNSHSVQRRKLTPINASTFLGCQMPFQKLLFSATLSQNPEKIAPLELFHPIFFLSKVDGHNKVDEQNDANEKSENPDGEIDVERFIIPEKLEEKIVIVEVDEKPLVLVFLMLDMKWKGVLCFTNSIEATHRLCLLLQSFQGFTVAEFSSNLSETQRKGIIRDFNSGKVDLLISSDAMARGMDIDTVKLVVNYDPAANAKTYVHRVGRTARAGKEGHAFTILCRKEVYHFKLMMKKLSCKQVPKMNISSKKFDVYQEQYQEALTKLQERVSLEHRNIKAGKFLTKRT